MTTTVKGMEISAEETLSKDGLNRLQQDVLYGFIVEGSVVLDAHDQGYYLTISLNLTSAGHTYDEMLTALESLVEMGRVQKYVESVPTNAYGKSREQVRVTGRSHYSVSLHDADGNPYPFFGEASGNPVLAAVAVFDSLTYKALGAQKVECDIAEQCRRPKEDVQLLLGLVEQGVDEGLYVVTTQDFLVDVPDSHGGTQPGTCTYYTVQFA